jgi:acetyltransferase-like isoleucine patch superfamily enzyme
MNLLKFLAQYRTDLLNHFKLLRLRLTFSEAYISNRACIKYDNILQLRIGINSEISDFTTLIIMDDPRNNVKNSFLSIGSNTYIGEYNNIRAGGGSIEIGDNCSISQHISIIASNHTIKKHKHISAQPWDLKNNFVIIKDGAWIGANSIILPGVTVGFGAVVGAGSLVNKDIPDYAVVIGTPAKVIKFRQ